MGYTTKQVEDAFDRVFDRNMPFGSQTYVITGNEPEKVKNAIIKNYLEYKGEVPLLAFDYDDNFDMGFVITNMKFAWRYVDKRLYSVDIDDISRGIYAGMLATKQIRLIDMKGREYKDIYSVGMDNKEMFVASFNKFITILKSTSSNTERTGRGVIQNDTYIDNVNRFIEDLSDEFQFSRQIYFYEIGEKSYKKFNGAQSSYAKLKDGEIPIVCYDVTISGDASDGALITTRGIYIHNYTEDPIFIKHSNIKSVKFDNGLFSSSLKVNDVKIDTSGVSDDYIKKFVRIIEICAKTFSD